MRGPRLGALLASAALGCVPASAEELAVIVHARNQASLTTTDLARIYLRQRRYWRDGQRMLPVNRDAGSVERRLFDRLVFGADAQRLAVYWNRQYFRGTVPPATLASDEAMKRFVASEPRAIGYVTAGAVDGSVRVVLRLREVRSP